MNSVTDADIVIWGENFVVDKTFSGLTAAKVDPVLRNYSASIKDWAYVS